MCMLRCSFPIKLVLHLTSVRRALSQPHLITFSPHLLTYSCFPELQCSRPLVYVFPNPCVASGVIIHLLPQRVPQVATLLIRVTTIMRLSTLVFVSMWTTIMAIAKGI